MCSYYKISIDICRPVIKKFSATKRTLKIPFLSQRTDCEVEISGSLASLSLIIARTLFIQNIVCVHRKNYSFTEIR